MAKEGLVLVEGLIIDVQPNATFKVKLTDSGLTVMCYVSGKMRRHEIRILLGDSVDVEISPYDFHRGRIVRRN